MLLFLLIAWLATQAPKFPLRLPKLHLPKVRCLCCPKGDKDDVTTFVRPREDRRIRLNVSFTNILSSDVGSTPAHLLTPKAFNGSRLSDQFVHPLEVPSDEIPSSRLELPSPMTDSSKIVNESSMATRATQSTDSSRLFAIPDQVNVAEWKQHKASCKDSHHTSHHSASAMLAILPHSASALATPDTDSHDTVDTPVFPLGVDSTDTDTSTSKGSTSSSMTTLGAASRKTTYNLVEGSILGTGQFGIVYAAHKLCQNGSQVAIKSSAWRCLQRILYQ
eukprot:833779_1